MPQTLIVTDETAPQQNSNVGQALPQGTGVAWLPGGGSWVYAQFYITTIVVNVPFRPPPGVTGYDGIYTTSVSDCYVVALLYPDPAIPGTFSRASFAHINGGNLKFMDWAAMFDGMPDRASIQVVLATGVHYAPTDANIQDALQQNGVDPTKITLYHHTPNKLLSGFGVDKNGFFGECSSGGPANSTTQVTVKPHDDINPGFRYWYYGKEGSDFDLDLEVILDFLAGLYAEDVFENDLSAFEEEKEFIDFWCALPDEARFDLTWETFPQALQMFRASQSALGGGSFVPPSNPEDTIDGGDGDGPNEETLPAAPPPGDQESSQIAALNLLTTTDRNDAGRIQRTVSLHRRHKSL